MAISRYKYRNHHWPLSTVI